MQLQQQPDKVIQIVTAWKKSYVIVKAVFSTLFRLKVEINTLLSYIFND